MSTPPRSINPPTSFKAANQGVSLWGSNATNRFRSARKSTVVAKNSSMKPQANSKCIMDA